jgi:hypothetical protein
MTSRFDLRCGPAARNCIWLAPPALVYKVPELENLARTGA